MEKNMKKTQLFALLSTLAIQATLTAQTAPAIQNVDKTTLKAAFGEIANLNDLFASKRFGETTSSNNMLLKASKNTISKLRQLAAETSGLRESTVHLINDFAGEIDTLNTALEKRDYTGEEVVGYGKYVQDIAPANGNGIISPDAYISTVKSLLGQSIDTFLTTSANKFIKDGSSHELTALENIKDYIQRLELLNGVEPVNAKALPNLKDIVTKNLTNFKADVDAHASLKFAIENSNGPLEFIKNLLEFIKNRLTSSSSKDIYNQLTQTDGDASARLETLKQQAEDEYAVMSQTQQDGTGKASSTATDKAINEANDVISSAKSGQQYEWGNPNEWQTAEAKYMQTQGSQTEPSEERGDFSHAFAPEEA